MDGKKSQDSYHLRSTYSQFIMVKLLPSIATFFFGKKILLLCYYKFPIVDVDS